jgi:hypothetical protein
MVAMSSHIGWRGGWSILLPASAYVSKPPTEGAGPTYKTPSGPIIVMIGGIRRGKGSFLRRCYLMKGLSSWVFAYGILHIVNGSLPGGAYPLAAS